MILSSMQYMTVEPQGKLLMFLYGERQGIRSHASSWRWHHIFSPILLGSAVAVSKHLSIYEGRDVSVTFFSNSPPKLCAMNIIGRSGES